MASAFWWASHTVVRLLSTKLSLFPFWGMLLLEEWGSLGQGLTMAAVKEAASIKKAKVVHS